MPKWTDEDTRQFAETRDKLAHGVGISSAEAERAMKSVLGRYEGPCLVLKPNGYRGRLFPWLMKLAKLLPNRMNWRAESAIIRWALRGAKIVPS